MYFEKNRAEQIPYVSRQRMEEVKSQFGIEYTNPIKDPLPSFSFAFKDGEKSEGVNFTYGAKEMAQNQKTFKQIDNALTKGSSSVNIFSEANAITWMRNPHTAIENWQKAIGMNNARILQFDIETLGDMDGGFFTPTEIAFKKFKIDNGLTRTRGTYKSWLVAPNENFLNAMTGEQGLLERVRDQLKAGQTPTLSSSESRTIADLIKYSEGANIVKKSDKTEMLSPSQNYYKYVDQKSKRVLWQAGDTSPIDKALEGLEALKNKGTDYQTVGQELQNYVQKQLAQENTFFMGHNIETFDIRGINKSFGTVGQDIFNPSRYIDSYELMYAIHPSYRSMMDMGIMPTQQMLNDVEGLYKMENLVRLLGHGDYIHSASTDIDKAAKATGDLFFSNEAQDFIMSNVIKEGGVTGKSTRTATYNTKALQQGDTLISTRAGWGGEGVNSFKTKVVEGQEVVQNSRYYLNTQTPYVFEGSYQSGEQYGVKLRNAMTDGEFVYINMNNQKDLRNFMYSNFVNGNGFSEKQMHDIWMNARNDSARTSFRKATGTVGFGNYKRLHDFLEAARLEREKGFQYLLDGGFDEVFSFNKKGKRVRMSNYDEYYSVLHSRIESEYDFLNGVVQRIEKHGKSAGWSEQQKHRAVINAYQKAQEEFGRNTDIINLEGPKRYGFSLMGPDGGDWFINLADEGSAYSSLKRVFNYTENYGGRNKRSAHNFFMEVLDRVSDHASTLEDNKTKELFMHSLQNHIGKAATNSGDTYYNTRALANLLVEYRDKIPGFHTGSREVEGLGRTSKETVEKMVKNMDRFVEHGIKMTNGFTDIYGTKFVPNKAKGLDNPINRLFKGLDDNLRDIYRAHGITGSHLNGINSMQDSFYEFLGDMSSQLKKKNSDLGFQLYSSGTADKPMVSIALFNKKSRESLMNTSLDKLRRERNVSVLDIPLISADQYIHYGNQKKVSPLLLLERNDLAKSGMGNINVKTSFDRMMDTIQGSLGSIMNAAQDGDFVEIENIVRGNINDALESLSGADSFNKSLNGLNAVNASSDFVKKHYVSFKDVFYDKKTSSWFGLDGKQMYAGDKKEIIENEELFNILQEKLGNGFKPSIASTRGAHIVQGFISAYDIRHHIPLGMYNNPGRENMVQQWNRRNFSGQGVEQLAESMRKRNGFSGMSFNHLFMSESERALRTLGGGFDTPTVHTLVANVSEFEMIEKLRKSADDLGYDWKKLFPTQATFPSVWENQVLAAEDFVESIHSSNVYHKSFADMKDLNPKLKAEIKNEIAKNGKYKLGYMEEILNTKPGSPNIKWERAARHYITDFAEDEAGNIVDLTLEEEYTGRPGVTKLLFGSEKTTIRNSVPRDLLEDAFGEGVVAVGNFNHEGHGAYGDVAGGYIKQAVARAQEIENKGLRQEALNEVSEVVNKHFGLNVKVINNDVIYDDMSNGFKQVKGLSQLVDDLASIDGIKDSFDENLLMLETSLAQNSEDINFLSVDGSVGKQGARFSPRHVKHMRANGFDNFADWMEDFIIDTTSETGEVKSLVSQANAAVYLDRVRKGEEIVPTKSPVKWQEIDTKFSELHKGRINGKKGLYSDEEIAQSIVGQKGMWLELPKEARVNIDKINSYGTKVNEDIALDKVFLARPHITKTDKGDNVLSPLAHAEYSIFEALRDYNEGTYHGEKIEDMTPEKAKRKAIERLNEGLDKYYSTVLRNASSSKGDLARKGISARLPGSGRATMQIMSPALEIAGAVENKGVKDAAEALGISEDFASRIHKEVIDSGQKPITNPNIMYANPKRIEDMLKGLPEDKYKEAMKSLEEGKGLAGYSSRAPVIHTYSGMPVEIRADKNLDYDNVRIPASMAVGNKGDSDGDQLTFIFAFHKKGYRFKHKEMLDEIEYAGFHLSEMNPGGRGTMQKQMAQDMQKDYYKAKRNKEVFDIEDSAENVIKNWNEYHPEWSAADKEDYFKRIANARLKNPLYTGMIDNAANAYRQIGLAYLDDQQDLLDFQSAIGTLIQDPISGKHEMTKDLTPEESLEMIGNWLKKGKISNLKEFDLTDEELGALGKAYDRAGKEEFDNLINNMFMSDKIAKEMGLGGMLDSLSEGVASVDRQMGDKVMWKEHADYMVKQISAETKDMINVSSKNQGYTFSDEAQKKAIKMTASAGEAIENISSQSFKKFGPVALVGSLLGGMAIGGGMASDAPLPMDYMNQQALKPHSGNSSRQAMMNQQSVENLMKQQGMDVIIKGNTTMDKDVNELAGVVAQSMQSSMNVPVNINVNANDNRNNISESWIEKQVLSILN